MAALVGIIDTNLIDLVVCDSMCTDTSTSVKTEELLVCSCARHGKRSSCRTRGPEEKAPRNSSPTKRCETLLNLGCLQMSWSQSEGMFNDKPGIETKLSTYSCHLKSLPKKAQAGLSQVLHRLIDAAEDGGSRESRLYPS